MAFYRIALTIFLGVLASTALRAKETSDTDDKGDKVLVLPSVSTGAPAAGKRVRVTTDQYKDTSVHHMLFLPEAWTPDASKKYPVIVEYTGNRFLKSGSTGEAKDAGLGYGISGGNFIWVTLPFIAKDHKSNAVTWWGDVDATVAYAKKYVPQICKEFHGDLNSVFLCGFSRGAIGVNFIGLHDDEIAKLWRGFITHDHFDGEREWRGTEWGSPLSEYRTSAKQRLARIKGRPYLVCQNGSTAKIEEYVKSANVHGLGSFTFLDVDTEQILGPFPNSAAIHPHTDRWLLKPSDQRLEVWQWVDSVLAR